MAAKTTNKSFLVIEDMMNSKLVVIDSERVNGYQKEWLTELPNDLVVSYQWHKNKPIWHGRVRFCSETRVKCNEFVERQEYEKFNAEYMNRMMTRFNM